VPRAAAMCVCAVFFTPGAVPSVDGSEPLQRFLGAYVPNCDFRLFRYFVKLNQVGPSSSRALPVV
jgi:hypothetical protein